MDVVGHTGDADGDMGREAWETRLDAGKELWSETRFGSAKDPVIDERRVLLSRRYSVRLWGVLGGCGRFEVVARSISLVN